MYTALRVASHVDYRLVILRVSQFIVTVSSHSQQSQQSWNSWYCKVVSWNCPGIWNCPV